MDESLKQLWEYLVFPLIGLFGGIVKYLQSVLGGTKFSWIAFFIEGVTALFLGLLITLIGKEMEATGYWLGACSGLGGWLGADFVKNLIRHYSRLPIPDEPLKRKPR